jgi:hypothetical protein
MFVARIPNRNSPPAILLRESYREGDKVKSRTLANLSHWSDDKIDALRRVLKGEALVSPTEQLRIERSLPHGHVAAVLGSGARLVTDELALGFVLLGRARLARASQHSSIYLLPPTSFLCGAFPVLVLDSSGYWYGIGGGSSPASSARVLGTSSELIRNWFGTGATGPGPDAPSRRAVL